MHHPNTVQFLGACTRKQPFMIITEYMPGGSLADLLRRPSSFPSMRRAIVMAIDCARAMTYLHLLECVSPIMPITLLLLQEHSCHQQPCVPPTPMRRLSHAGFRTKG